MEALLIFGSIYPELFWSYLLEASCSTPFPMSTFATRTDTASFTSVYPFQKAFARDLT